MSNSSDWSDDDIAGIDVVSRFVTKATASRFDIPYSMLPRPRSTQRCFEQTQSEPRITKIAAALQTKLGEGCGLYCEQVASLVERQHLPHDEWQDRVRTLLHLCDMPLVQEMLRANAVHPAAFVTMTELSFASHHEWYRQHVRQFDRQRDLQIADAPIVTHQYTCPSCGCDACTITAMPTGVKVKWGGDSDDQTTVTCTGCGAAFIVG